MINTGRSLSQTLAGLDQHQVFLTPDYIIAQECEIYRPGLLKSWTDFGSWNKRAHAAHDHFVEKHGEFLQQVKAHVETYEEAVFLLGELGQVGVVARDDEQMSEMCVEIDQWLLREPEVGYHRNGRYMRFSHSGFSKGTALAELARMLGVSREFIFAAGDNYNDLSMLDRQIAEYIACPGNALEPVKNHLRQQGGFVAEKFASEGMIEALVHFFKLRVA